MNAKFSFGAIALIAALGACSQKSQDTTTNAVTDIGSDVGNATSGAMDAAGNITGNALDAAGNALNPTPTGQEFADKAAKSDAFEIAAAKLAKTNAESADVKKFAATMIDAHTGSTAKIKAAATKATPAIKPDPTLTSDQQSKLDDLGKLKGADFDKAYVDGQISAHEDALSLMKSYADKGDTTSLKTAAGEIAPKVQEHLDMAKKLKK
jgi:putative membrane protein